MNLGTILDIEITNKCNMNCSYCRVKARPGNHHHDCSEKTLFKFFDFVLACEERRLDVVFSGGEPLLRKDIVSCGVEYGYKKARELGKNIRFHLLTNGTLLDAEFGYFIVNNNIELSVSLDGPELTHNKFRKFIYGSGSFETVVNNIKIFRKLHPKYNIRICAAAINHNDIAWIYNFLDKLQPATLRMNTICAPSDLGLRKTFDWIIEAALAEKKRFRHFQNAFLHKTGYIDKQIENAIKFCLNKRERNELCTMPFNTSVTSTDGQIYPCPFFVGYKKYQIGNIWEGTNNNKIKEIINLKKNKLAMCIDCEEKNLCGGGCLYLSEIAQSSFSQNTNKFCDYFHIIRSGLTETIINLSSIDPERILPLIKSEVTPKQKCNKQTNDGWKTFIIKLTDECNLDCSYCYEKDLHYNPNSLNEEKANILINYLLEHARQRQIEICFFGGEPLINWDVCKYIVESLNLKSKYYNNKPKFRILTNGTLITHEISEFFSKYNIAVQISVDGLQHVHDNSRRFKDGEGTYNQVIEAISILKEVDHRLPVNAQVVITPLFLDQVSIAKILRKIGFNAITFFFQTGRKGKKSPWTLSDIKRLAYERERYFSYFIKSAKAGTPEVDTFFAWLVAYGLEGPPRLCECGKTEIFINCNGEIFPCAFLQSWNQFKIGSCFEEKNKLSNMHEIKGLCKSGNDYFQHNTEVIHDLNCEKCWAKDRCSGGCLALSGSCYYVPEKQPTVLQNSWCNLLRQEFARGILANRILAREAPSVLKMIQEKFIG